MCLVNFVPYLGMTQLQKLEDPGRQEGREKERKGGRNEGGKKDFSLPFFICTFSIIILPESYSLHFSLCPLCEFSTPSHILGSEYQISFVTRLQRK